MGKEYGIIALPSSYSKVTGRYRNEYGWTFTVSKKMFATGARTYAAEYATTTINLWDASTGTRLAQISSAGGPTNQWNEKTFSTPIELTPDKTYVISAPFYDTYQSSAANTAQFNSKITYVNGRYGTSSNSFPNIVQSNWLYPFVDIVVDATSYKSSGNAIFAISDYSVGGNDTLSWTASTPEDTSVAFSASINQGAWQSISNGGIITGLPAVGQTCNLRVKVELSTTNVKQTPTVTQIKIASNGDKKKLVLNLNTPNFSSAVGNMTISYDGLGGLQGVGGPAAAFDGAFTPSGLTWKGHQNDEEHIEVGVAANVVLTEITYHTAQEPVEHVEVSVAATVTLTDIHDL